MKAAALVLTLVGLAAMANAQLGRLEVRLGVAGVFNRTAISSDGARRLEPTDSLDFLGSVRWHFSAMHSLEVNIGHTDNSQIYSLSPNVFRITTTVTEYSGAYVLSPRRGNRFEPFVFAGAGGLRFSPKNTLIDGLPALFGATSQTSLAFLYGGGTEYRLWRVFNLRLEYRGLIYRNPDFSITPLFTGSRGHMAEPAAGIVVKF